MSRTDRAPRWLVLLVVLTVLPLGCAVLGTRGPAVAVYASADFTHLPAATDGCASIHQVGDSKELVEQACGSSASTFRVIGRVGESSQCVGDADLIYTWSSQMLSGAVCLDYDWTPGQCMLITPDTAAKSDCADSASVRPDGAIIGAVDVSYCRSGGIPHPVRHFAICTIPGNEPADRRTNGS